jgi:hypothetical protein
MPRRNRPNSLAQCLIARHGEKFGAIRRGVITLELIVAMPVLVIVIMAVVEFAIIYQVNEEVAGAARFGAKLAAEITRNHLVSPRLSNYNTPGVNHLKERIDQYLQNHGLTPSCEVILQHTACVPFPYQENPTPIPGTCPCTIIGGVTSPFGLAAVEPPPGEAYVRVTVVVNLSGNVPNLLATFGLPLGNLTLQESCVFRIETNNTPPSIVVTGTPTFVPVNYTQTGTFGCGNTVTFSNALGTTVGPGDVTIQFDATGTTDLEQPPGTLSYSWTTTGVGFNPSASPASGTGTTYTTTLQRPPDPNTNPTTTEPDLINTYTTTLTVTDSCGAVSTCVLTTVLITRDSDPAP